MSAPRRESSWDVVFQDPTGLRKKTRLFVGSREAVRDEVRKAGGVLLHAKPHRRGLLEKELFTTRFRSAFLTSLLFYIDAGASPGQALALVVESQRNPRIRGELNGALEVVHRGGSFTDGLAALGIFDDVVIGMLSAGELAGDLPTAVKAAHAHFEEKGGWLKAWKPFAVLLFVELSTALSALWAMFAMVVPALMQNPPAAEKPEDIDHYLRMLSLTGSAAEALFWASSFAIALIAALVVAYRSGDPASQRLVERIMPWVPGLRAMLIDSSLSFTAGLVANLLKARLRFTEAVPLAVRHTSMPSVRNMWQSALDRLSKGVGVARAFEHRLIEPAELIVLEAHQDADQLSRVFQLISKSRKDAVAEGRRYALWFYGVLTAVYLFGVAGMGLWLVKLQGDGLSLQSIGGMSGF